MNETFSNLITSNSIAIVLPVNPYFDQVASGLSMYLSLVQMGKDVTIYSPQPMLVEFNRLVAVDKVTTELGNKNLLIRFPGYNAVENVDRVSFDIDGDEGFLKIIPKPGIVPPKIESVNLSYTGLLADSAILIGGGNETHFPCVNTKDFLDVKLLHVGIRELRLNSEKPLYSFAKQGSSISEVVYFLLKDNALTINPDIATNLLMGIEEGTKGLTSTEVNADTFQALADLMRAGARRITASQMPRRQQFPQGSIPGEAPKLQTQPQSQPQAQSVQSTSAPKPGAPQSWLEPKIYRGGGDNSSAK